MRSFQTCVGQGYPMNVTREIVENVCEQYNANREDDEQVTFSSRMLEGNFQQYTFSEEIEEECLRLTARGIPIFISIVE